MELNTPVALLMSLPMLFWLAVGAVVEPISALELEMCSGNLSDCSATDIGWAADEHLALVQRAATLMHKDRSGQSTILKEQKPKHAMQSAPAAALASARGNQSVEHSAVLMQSNSNQTMLDRVIDHAVERMQQGAEAMERLWNPPQKAEVAITLAITAFPAAAMALGSAAISLGSPPELLQLRLQHLSAGLLVGACLTNIFPILQLQLIGTTFHKKRLQGMVQERVIHWANVFASICGFGLAMAAMYGVKSLELEEDSDSEADDEKAEETEESRERSGTGLFDGQVSPGEGRKLRMLFSRLAAHSNTLSEQVQTDSIDRDAVDEEIHGIDFLVDSARRLAKGAEPIDKRNAARLRFHVSELIDDVRKLTELDVGGSTKLLDSQLKAVSGTLQHCHTHAERANFRRWRPSTFMWSPQASRQEHAVDDKASDTDSIPWALTLAVVLDSFVDGMLIGLAASVATGSGILMAIATAIEMGFLGYSFACTVMQSVRFFRACVVLAMPPVAMLVAATAAGAGATVVEGTPMFVALIAFALVALLFLVVDELLAEAKEKEESGQWDVGIWLYIGLIASIVLDVLI